MKVLFACLADYASEDASRKLNLMGIFDTVQAKQFPALHPRMFFVFRLMVEHDDGGEKGKLTVVMRDDDHQELQRLEAQFQVHAVPPGEFGVQNLIMELNGLVFPQAGRYHVAVKVDGQPEVQVPLKVSAL